MSATMMVHVTIPTDPIVVTPPSVVAMVAALADCLCGMLASDGAGPTCWCGVYPGSAISWEYCGECSGDTCGMGWVRPASVFPYETFPTPLGPDPRCRRPLAWAVEIGALRCMPIPHDGGLVSPDAMMAVAVDQMLDAQAIHRAISCCDNIDAAVERYIPVGPAGACVGGYWVAYLDVPGY